MPCAGRMAESGGGAGGGKTYQMAPLDAAQCVAVAGV